MKNASGPVAALAAWVLALLPGSAALADPPAPSPVTCRVQQITFAPGFFVSVDVINTATAPVTGWTVTFTAPLSTAVFNNVNTVMTRDGTRVALTPVAYNTTLPPGGLARIGFYGRSNGPTFDPPTGYSTGGVPCAPV